LLAEIAGERACDQAAASRSDGVLPQRLLHDDSLLNRFFSSHGMESPLEKQKRPQDTVAALRLTPPDG
jgi:hypothetical protein